MAVFAFTSCLAQQNFTVDIWPNGTPNSNEILGEIQKETESGRLYLTQEAKVPASIFSAANFCFFVSLPILIEVY